MRVAVSVHKFDEVDIDKLVSLAFHSRYRKILRDNGVTPEKYRQILQDYRNQKNENVVVLAQNPRTEKIIGWMHIYIGFPLIYFIGAWHPIIERNPNEDIIVSELLTAAIEFTRRSGINTLEVHFNEITEDRDSLYEVYADWYQSQPFSKITEEAYLECNLEKYKSITMETKPEYKFVSLSDVSNNSLHDPFFDAFVNSEDVLFNSQTREQQEIAFKYWFDRSESFCDKSSFVILKDDEVIGFSAVRPKENIGEIGPIGIIPKYRGKGLGKLLLAISLNGMVGEGIKRASLEVSLENTTAMNLYEKFGFKQRHSTIYYAWKSS